MNAVEVRQALWLANQFPGSAETNERDTADHQEGADNAA